MAYIMPQTVSDLLENELLDLSKEGKKFIKRFVEVFLCEIRYFVGTYNLRELIRNRGGVAYQLIKETSGGNVNIGKDGDGLKLGGSKKVKKHDKFSVSRKE